MFNLLRATAGSTAMPVGAMHKFYTLAKQMPCRTDSSGFSEGGAGFINQFDVSIVPIVPRPEPHHREPAADQGPLITVTACT
jgi:hypothetical protein